MENEPVFCSKFYGWFLLTEDERAALADFGADVADGRMTSEQAIAAVLSPRFREPA